MIDKKELILLIIGYITRAKPIILDPRNLTYGSLLTDIPVETRPVGYADGVAALIAARNVEVSQLRQGHEKS